MKGSAVLLWAVIAVVALAPAGSAQQSCPFNVGGIVFVSSPTQVGALVPSGVPDTCVTTAPCVAQGSQPVNYNVYTLVNNNTASPTCVTAKLTAACGVQGVTEMYLAAYSPSFNPSSICQNYIGASGTTAINSQVSASFNVPPGAPFQVVVSLPLGGQCEYTLNVTGCGANDPQPVPALSPEGIAALLLALAACGWWRLRRSRSSGRA